MPASSDPGPGAGAVLRTGDAEAEPPPSAATSMQTKRRSPRAGRSLQLAIGTIVASSAACSSCRRVNPGVPQTPKTKPDRPRRSRPSRECRDGCFFNPERPGAPSYRRGRTGPRPTRRVGRAVSSLRAAPTAPVTGPQASRAPRRQRPPPTLVAQVVMTRSRDRRAGCAESARSFPRCMASRRVSPGRDAFYLEMRPFRRSGTREDSSCFAGVVSTNCQRADRVRLPDGRATEWPSMTVAPHG
jgi:hypothetical protein